MRPSGRRPRRPNGRAAGHRPAGHLLHRRQRQPAWWAQYGRINYLAGQLDGPNGDVALAALREIAAPYVHFHEGRPPEWAQEQPTE